MGVTVRSPQNLRDPKGAKDFGVSIKPYDARAVEGPIKIGKAGRRLIKSDETGEKVSSRQKYIDNYDRIFGKK